MSRPINVIAPGLLGFFQLKQSGKNPDELSDTVIPSLEMFDWYMQARLVDSFITIGGGASSTRTSANGVTGFVSFTTNPIEVPQGEAWWVWNYNVTTNALPAGDSVQFAPAIAILGASVIPYPVANLSTLIQGSAAGRPAIHGASGFFAGSGARFGLYSTVNETATNVTYAGWVRYARLQL